MEKLFITELNKYNLKYIKIKNETSLTKIYNLFKSNIFEESSTDIEYFYYGVYYDEIEKNYDLMKKYYLMAIELNNSPAMYNLADYYKKIGKNDQTFVELYKYEDKKYFIKLFNYKFKDNINLDQKYYYSFLQWKSEKISHKVKMKQYILRKTNIFPKNYDKKYLFHFIEFISLKNTRLAKDILNLIAGHLFI